jgi:energy-coupling factor transporter ATP-binding protein EcfA2
MNLTETYQFLESRGKATLNPSFKIYQEDHELILKLLAYFTNNQQACQKYAISLRKGLMLSGPVGCGKTSLMRLFNTLLLSQFKYQVKPCRDISFEFNRDGYTVIHKYSTNSYSRGQHKIYCFDDLGTENHLKFYGVECNVMAEILLSRYDQFTLHGLQTHLTTNLTSMDIEEQYGKRVRSRMREMFNLLAFDSGSVDKRR